MQCPQATLLQLVLWNVNYGLEIFSRYTAVTEFGGQSEFSVSSAVTEITSMLSYISVTFARL